MTGNGRQLPVHEISIIGLGKVGLPMAAGFGAAGVKVTGFDSDPGRGELLQTHDPEDRTICLEAGLSAALVKARPNLQAADNIGEALEASDISFVIVPTPSEADGSFSLDYVADAFAEIGQALPHLNRPHLIVLVSTVSPGSVSGTLIGILEKHSGLKLGKGFHLAYSPALIALGDVICGFMQPDFAFVGETHSEGGDQLAAFYRDILPENTPLHRMSAQSVEIAKIALNNFLTMKISFSNLIGQLCNETIGADAHQVLGALGDDHRIGSAYLKPGMPFGGPCLPRDNAALASSLQKAGLASDLPDAAFRINQELMRQLANLTDPGPGKRIAVIGLGYKAGSNLTDESAAIIICNHIAQTGAEVRVGDPQINNMDLTNLDADVQLFADLEEAVRGCDTVLITGYVQTDIDVRSLCLPDTCVIDIGDGFAIKRGNF